MQQITGTVSGISHLHEGWRRRKPVISFNANIAGARRFDVALPRSARIQEGMTATFVLSATNNWQTVIAFRESAEGKIFTENMQQEWAACLSSLLVLYLVTRHGMPTLPTIGWLCVIILVCVDGYALSRLAKVFKARRLLTAGIDATH